MWAIDIKTGNRRLMAQPLGKFKAAETDLSKDGRQIVFDGYFRETHGIFIVDTSWAIIRNITQFGYRPRWSSKGTQIAFSTMVQGAIAEENVIFIYSLQDSTLRQISPQNGLRFTHPEWSPDDRWIICVAGEGSIWELWRIEIATGHAHQLGEQKSWTSGPVWSPSGEFIYFVSQKNGSPDLWRVPVEVSTGELVGAPVQITNGVNLSALNISPQGDKFVFSKGSGGGELWQVRLWNDTTTPWQEAKRLTHDMPGVENIESSPDGTKLAIESSPGGIRQLSVYSIIERYEILLYNQQPPFAPSWSPDGKWIAFDAGGGNNADIWRIPVSGGQVEKIIEHPGADWMPTYAPDGMRLCFVSNRSGQFDLWLQDLQTGEIRQITHTPGKESRGSWSHDGRKLAFFYESTDSRTCEIRVYNFITGRTETLQTFPPAQLVVYPILAKIVWRADDAAVYYFSHGKLLMEVSLATKAAQEAFKIAESEHITFGAFTIFENFFYFAIGNDYWDFWIGEGL
jgi:Tol biopolymer transport system component